jgi:undecaprenyl-diphosphatase
MLAVMAAGLGPPWFAALLLIWAPLVTLARVAMGVHYLSDVLAGALFGLLLGLVYLRISAGMG